MDDVGGYAQFFKELVTGLAEAKQDMHQTVRKEGRELLEQLGDRIFTNLYMLNTNFPFDEVLKPPCPDEMVKAARDVVADHTAMLIDLYEREADGGGEPSWGLISTSDASEGHSDPGGEDLGTS